jgi:hypothetical protein
LLIYQLRALEIKFSFEIIRYISRVLYHAELEISNLERVLERLREDPSLFKQPGLFRYL